MNRKSGKNAGRTGMDKDEQGAPGKTQT